MKPRISEKGRKILRDYNLGRALMECIHKKKYEHKPEHPMLFSVNYKDIKDEAEQLKNK
jgi:hypothetical protein